MRPFSPATRTEVIEPVVSGAPERFNPWFVEQWVKGAKKRVHVINGNDTKWIVAEAFGRTIATLE